MIYNVTKKEQLNVALVDPDGKKYLILHTLVTYTDVHIHTFSLSKKFIRIRYNLPESAQRRKQSRLIYARRVFARCSDNFLRRGFKRSDGQLYTSALANYGNPSWKSSKCGETTLTCQKVQVVVEVRQKFSQKALMFVLMLSRCHFSARLHVCYLIAGISVGSI